MDQIEAGTTKAIQLRPARVAFTRALARLIAWAFEHGYEIALAEGMDRITEKDPTTDHMKGSAHEIGLAQDIDLYINGKYQSSTEAHAPLGKVWEQLGLNMGLPLVWGGHFGDGNHYSYKYQNRK